MGTALTVWICPDSARHSAQGPETGGESIVISAGKGWALLNAKARGPRLGGVLFSVGVGRNKGDAAASAGKSSRYKMLHIRSVLGGLPAMAH